MKKNLLTIAAILIIAITFGETSHAQFGDLINKAKDAAKKKKDKVETKAETKPTDNKGSGNGSADSGNKPSKNDSPPAQNMLEMYYSNQPFPADGSVQDSQNSFASNENIYGRIVLKGGTVKEVLKPAEPNDKIKGYHLDFRLIPISESNGVKKSFFSRIFKLIISKSDLDKTYLDFDVLPSPDNAKTLYYWGGNPNDGISYGFDVYNFLLDKETKEGIHEIFCELKINEFDFRGNPLPEKETKYISTKIDFTFSGSDYAKIKANKAKLDKDFEANYKAQKTANEPVPAEWTAQTSPIIGGYTTASISNLFRNSFSSPAANLKIIKLFAKAPAVQGMWSVEYNDLGIPRYRYSSQWFTVFVQDTAYNGCFYQGFGLRQNYDGGGTYGKVFVDHGDSKLIMCSKLGLK